jgi:predicted small lipoprotein YifL
MKRKISILLITVMLCMMLIPVAGCGKKTDYSNPHNAIVAADRGIHLEGKTIKVKATTDVTLGYFYNETDLGIGANVAVGVYTDDNILGLDMDYTGIRKGQTVTGTIRYYDDHLKTSRIILIELDE